MEEKHMAKVLEFDTFMQEAKGENLTVRDCAADDGACGETG